jgi:hypothetical protein
MSEAGSAVLEAPERKPGAPEPNQKRVTELRVTGHLMTLETGVFCVFQAPGTASGGDDTGLPGVRISLPPGPAGNPDAVSISTFRADGWLSGRDAAALVRVSDGPAQVLVTVYQSPNQGAEGAPRLQVLRLSTEPAAAPQAPAANDATSVPAAAAPAAVVAHVQRTGDVGGRMGDWLGQPGSKLWIEGFAVTPPGDIAPDDLEYQAVLGRGWNSPWMEGGKFCGSRGMALPLLGVRLRLKGQAARTHTLRYAASFVDGTRIGPVDAGEACEAESLAALEALQVILEPSSAAGASAGNGAAPARKPSAGKQAVGKPAMGKPAPAKPAGAKPMVKPSRPAPIVRRAR